MSNVNAIVSQVSTLYAYGPSISQKVVTGEYVALLAHAAPTSFKVNATQLTALYAHSAGETNVNTQVSQLWGLYAFGEGIPGESRQSAWHFTLDGHKFYVLPLGPEGTWAYDTSTREWCKLQTQGFNGLNFQNGVMWGLRIIGSDALYTYLYEMDPNQPFDEGWREVEHIVTGGVATRSRASIGVANFTLTASVGDVSDTEYAISLAFSDDNGRTWSSEFEIPLTDVSTQKLIWNALGSFSAPGRVFRITDRSGPIRLDGADVVLTAGSGADSGEEAQ
jgi:hypothetical protein